MKPILTVEFTGKAGDYEFKEESVPIHSPEGKTGEVHSDPYCSDIEEKL
jgi:hypothetical protein